MKPTFIYEFLNIREQEFPPDVKGLSQDAQANWKDDNNWAPLSLNMHRKVVPIWYFETKSSKSSIEKAKISVAPFMLQPSNHLSW